MNTPREVNPTNFQLPADRHSAVEDRSSLTAKWRVGTSEEPCPRGRSADRSPLGDQAGAVLLASLCVPPSVVTKRAMAESARLLKRRRTASRSMGYRSIRTVARRADQLAKPGARESTP